MAKTIKDLNLEEAQALLAYVGIEDADKFKDEFGQKFFTKESAISNDEIISAVTGKRIKTLESKFLEIVKEFDPTITKSKLGEKHLEEAMDDYIPVFKTKLSELESKAKSGNDKKVSDLEKQYDDLNKSYQAQKEVTDRIESEYNKYKEESTNNIKSYKINHQLSELKNRIPWIDGMTEIQKAGYDTVLSSNYKFDLDEQDRLRILDKTGKPVQSKAKAAIADPLEILDLIAEENQLKKKNNAQNGKQFFQIDTTKESSGRKLPADYLKRVKA